MTTTKTKNDTTSVTASIMAVNVDKNKKPAVGSKVEFSKKLTAKVKPNAIPAPALAKTEDKKEKPCS